ncbi:adult-specific rigid cuticular protein 15.5 [Nephila pilipes]|uniref:Adult-specific rigid cuticular protein 15.5 n=1 Tax=Nephila pilipes TaxID=299642 RepID=A0A8X6MHH2_NEPPI|nr:adult-specific rigid cuticular protein 15.5 [Nephila pilipes]
MSYDSFNSKERYTLIPRRGNTGEMDQRHIAASRNMSYTVDVAEDAFIVLCMFIGAAVAQQIDKPIPYTFNYAAATDDGGSSARQESGDGAGRVTGSYSVNDIEGHARTVDYIADEGGFRVNIRTNEPGTANINPADVTMESSADSGAVSYSLGTASTSTRIVSPPSTGRVGVRYVLVPVTDPRARGYY